MTRFLLSIAFFAVLAITVGFLLSGRDSFDWVLALGLFAVALAGEGLRLWLRRGRARSRQSSAT
ncbi:hypothetical protein [Kribbella sancticallisti]|uniref:hypothetical protein n=1 Tax=Kribbella sancticallisti TaxID=460087 RepID=UPI0031E2AA85